MRLRARRTTVMVVLVLGVLLIVPTQANAKRSRHGSAPSGYTLVRTSGPAGTIVRDGSGAWVATFTDGARTVTLAGPSRTFSEASAADPVVSATWVRTLPQPFAGQVDQAWLASESTDTSPDVLAVAMQYVSGAEASFDSYGRQVAGDASFGPLQPDGTRAEGSDFNDYLGVAWDYGGAVDQPEPDQFLSLDCSGFMRMVWGERSGLPMSLSPDGTSLPRRAVNMLDSAPGVVTVADSGTQVTMLPALSPGDLVFFDISTDDGTAVDHVGMYIGRDTAGHYRFVSSRKTPDGPTFGDTAGKGILDGAGFYASGFRAVRRL